MAKRKAKPSATQLRGLAMTKGKAKTKLTKVKAKLHQLHEDPLLPFALLS